MSKLDMLFDGTTIINFPFMIKLFKRYLKSSILIGVLLALACGVFYFLQEDVYWTSISFSDATTEEKSDSTNKAMAALGGAEKHGGLRATDILNLRSSIDFNRNIATSLVESEFFPKLRFDLSLFGNANDSAEKIEKKCSLAKNCIINELVKRLPKFYQITDKDRNGVNFLVEVKALDSLTANVLLKMISKAILASRIEVVRYALKEQEKSNLNILIEKKKEVDISAYYELQEERDRLDSELKEVQSNLDHQVNVITSVQDNLASAEANYQHSKKISTKHVSNDDLESESRRKDLKDRIDKLNSDLTALEDATTNHSIKDEEIIAQLKKEIKETKKRLKSLGEGNSQTNLDQFVKQNDEKVHSKELEFKIIKDQLEAAKQRYDDLILKKKDVLGKKIKAEQSLEMMKPNIDFIKNLELQIEQLKLSNLSVAPDVRFDNYAATPDPVKKIGLILLAGYLIIMEGMMLMGYLALRYVIDNNIYDVEDLRGTAENLKIIGNGPKYG